MSDDFRNYQPRFTQPWWHYVDSDSDDDLVAEMPGIGVIRARTVAQECAYVSLCAASYAALCVENAESVVREAAAAHKLRRQRIIRDLLHARSSSAHVKQRHVVKRRVCVKKPARRDRCCTLLLHHAEITACMGVDRQLAVIMNPLTHTVGNLYDDVASIMKRSAVFTLVLGDRQLPSDKRKQPLRKFGAYVGGVFSVYVDT